MHVDRMEGGDFTLTHKGKICQCKIRSKLLQEECFKNQNRMEKGIFLPG